MIALGTPNFPRQMVNGGLLKLSMNRTHDRHDAGKDVGELDAVVQISPVVDGCCPPDKFFHRKLL
jgi:hypothetical protein